MLFMLLKEIENLPKRSEIARERFEWKMKKKLFYLFFIIIVEKEKKTFILFMMMHFGSSPDWDAVSWCTFEQKLSKKQLKGFFPLSQLKFSWQPAAIVQHSVFFHTATLQN